MNADQGLVDGYVFYAEVKQADAEGEDAGHHNSFFVAVEGNKDTNGSYTL